MDYDILGLKVGLQFDEKASLKNLREKLNEIQRGLKESLNVEITGIQQAVVDLKGLDESMKVLSNTFKNAFSTIDMGGLAKAMDTINKIDSSVFKKSADVTKNEAKKQADDLREYQKALEDIDKKYKSVSKGAKDLDKSLSGTADIMKRLDNADKTRGSISTDELGGKSFDKYQEQVSKLEASYEKIMQKQERSKQVESELVKVQKEHLDLIKKLEGTEKGTPLSEEYARQAQLVKGKITALKDTIKVESLTTEGIKEANAEYANRLDNIKKIAQAKGQTKSEAEQSKQEAEALRQVEARVKAVSQAYEDYKSKLQNVDDSMKKGTGISRTFTDLGKSVEKLSSMKAEDIGVKSLTSAEALVKKMATGYDNLSEKQRASKEAYTQINDALQQQISLIGKLSNSSLGENTKGLYTSQLEEAKTLATSLQEQAKENGLVTKEMQSQINLTQKLIEGAEALRQAKTQDANDKATVKEQKALEDTVTKLASTYEKLNSEASKIDDEIRNQNSEYQKSLEIIERIKENLKVGDTGLINPVAVQEYNTEMDKLVKNVDNLKNSQKTKDTGIANYIAQLKELYGQLIKNTKAVNTNDTNKKAFYDEETNAIQAKISALQTEIAQNGMLTGSVQEVIAKMQEQLAVKQKLVSATTDDKENTKMAQLKKQYDNLSATIQKLQNKMELFKAKSDSSFEPDKVQALENQIHSLAQAFEILDVTDDKAMNDLASDAKKVATEFSTVENKLKILNTQMDKSSNIGKGVFFGSLMSQLAMLPVASFRNAVTAVKDLDSALNTLSITMNVTDGDLNKLVEGARKSATQLGTTYDEIMEISKVYANANESVDSILNKIKPTAILATVSGIGAEQATSTVQAVLNQFSSLEGEITQKTERIADVFIAVSRSMSMDFGKGISEMSDGISQSGSVAEQAGVQFEEYVAMLSSTMEITRLSGSLKPIFGFLSIVI